MCLAVVVFVFGATCENETPDKIAIYLAGLAFYTSATCVVLRNLCSMNNRTMTFVATYIMRLFSFSLVCCAYDRSMSGSTFVLSMFSILSIALSAKLTDLRDIHRWVTTREKKNHED